MLDMNLMESIVAEYCAQRDYFEIKIHDWALSRNISSQKCRNICHLATKSWMDTFCASILVYKDIVKKKTWIHLLKGKIGGYNFKLFLPQLEYMKELCFPPIKNMHLYSGLNYRFAAGTCNNACFILWTGGSFCRLFTDVFFSLPTLELLSLYPKRSKR